MPRGVYKRKTSSTAKAVEAKISEVNTILRHDRWLVDLENKLTDMKFVNTTVLARIDNIERRTNEQAAKPKHTDEFTQLWNSLNSVLQRLDEVESFNTGSRMRANLFAMEDLKGLAARVEKLESKDRSGARVEVKDEYQAPLPIFEGDFAVRRYFALDFAQWQDIGPIARAALRSEHGRIIRR